ncbi:MAG: phenylalanine--tRNA ligase subunit beta, partial [Pseudomonadota bacterium]|nr:phenylalanine--tRNA ligase subunit beta [Pseudomonadota bacterium]
HEGLLVLDADAIVGSDLRQALNLDDVVFTLKLTPNLGHALSVFGVARELAALTGAPLKMPAFAPQRVSDEGHLRVRIAAADLCGRFSGRVIRHLKTEAVTPRWMADRLARCGQRCVAPLVDISNYVMFELGRPSHIFDLDRIEGGLEVRWARDGELLELLDGKTIELQADVGVIADATRVESLAGIMGGQLTAVSDETRNVYVEAAFWWPAAIAGRPRRYQISTDAAHRFERGVDAATTVEHLERLSELILAICGDAQTTCGPIADQITALPARPPVRLRVDRASRVVGVTLSQATCEDAMRRLGLSFRSEPGTLDVVAPSWRFDLEREEDLIEEVIRIVGYDSLPTAPPLGRLAALVRSESRRSAAQLRQALVERGWQETISFSFVDARWEAELAGNAEPIRVINPIAVNLGVMRSTLLGSLVDVLKFNLSRKATRVRIFELAKVYRRDAEAPAGPLSVAGVVQPLRLGGLAFGLAEPLQWASAARQVDFYDVKGDVEAMFAPAELRFVSVSHPALHPGRSARIERDGVEVGFIGELHPRWRQSYGLPASPIVFELDADALGRVVLPTFEPLPKQQPVWRDIAVVIGRDVTHGALLAAIGASAGGVVRDATLFDVYEPATAVAGIHPGERSVTIRLELRDDAAPLAEARIDSVVQTVVAALERDLRARLRTT